jgi:hypothetical protein
LRGEAAASGGPDVEGQTVKLDTQQLIGARPRLDLRSLERALRDFLYSVGEPVTEFQWALAPFRKSDRPREAAVDSLIARFNRVVAVVDPHLMIDRPPPVTAFDYVKSPTSAAPKSEPSWTPTRIARAAECIERARMLQAYVTVRPPSSPR